MIVKPHQDRIGRRDESGQATDYWTPEKCIDFCTTSLRNMIESFVDKTISLLHVPSQQRSSNKSMYDRRIQMGKGQCEWQLDSKSALHLDGFEEHNDGMQFDRWFKEEFLLKVLGNKKITLFMGMYTDFDFEPGRGTLKVLWKDKLLRSLAWSHKPQQSYSRENHPVEFSASFSLVDFLPDAKHVINEMLQSLERKQLQEHIHDFQKEIRYLVGREAREVQEYLKNVLAQTEQESDLLDRIYRKIGIVQLVIVSPGVLQMYV